MTGQCISATQAVIPIPFPVFARVVATGITVSNAIDFAITLPTGILATTTAVAFNNSNALNGGAIIVTIAAGLTSGNVTTFGAGTPTAKLFFTGCEL
jgi:hypothetical protein